MDYSFVLVLMFCCCSASGVHHGCNLTLCNDPTDPEIYRDEHRKIPGIRSSSLMYQEVVDLHFEAMKITCIYVVDLLADGTGGVASIRSGGLGGPHVTILLQGQLLRGYAFEVVVLGKPTTNAPSGGLRTSTTGWPDFDIPKVSGPSSRAEPDADLVHQTSTTEWPDFDIPKVSGPSSRAEPDADLVHQTSTTEWPDFDIPKVSGPSSRGKPDADLVQETGTSEERTSYSVKDIDIRIL